MIDPYRIVKTEQPSFYVNEAGHFTIQYAVISQNSKGQRRRTTYKIVLSGAIVVKTEELPKEELTP